MSTSLETPSGAQYTGFRPVPTMGARPPWSFTEAIESLKLQTQDGSVLIYARRNCRNRFGMLYGKVGGKDTFFIQRTFPDRLKLIFRAAGKLDRCQDLRVRAFFLHIIPKGGIP